MDKKDYTRCIVLILEYIDKYCNEKIKFYSVKVRAMVNNNNLQHFEEQFIVYFLKKFNGVLSFKVKLFLKNCNFNDYEEYYKLWDSIKYLRTEEKIIKKIANYKNN